MHARWGRNECTDWVFLLQKWSGVLVCGTRWKENGRGRSPKNIIQELFCQNGVWVEGTGKGREKVNRVGSVWAWMVWLKRESEKKWRERGIREELKVSEWEIRHNYRLTASQDDFSKGTPWTSEREGGCLWLREGMFVWMALWLLPNMATACSQHSNHSLHLPATGRFLSTTYHFD